MNQLSDAATIRKNLQKKAFDAHKAGAPEVLQAYARYLEVAPDDAAMWSNLGVLHRTQGRYHAALRAQERAQTRAPDDIGLRTNYANILSDLGHYNASIAARDWILAQNPDDADQKAMVGRCLRGKGDYDAATVYLGNAIAAHPNHSELRLQLAFAQLGAGDYAAGFETYRIRWQTGEMKPRNLPYPEWNGEPLTGKTVLVLPEQGFGDAILFARFVKQLKADGAHVLFLAEPPVAPLFQGLPGADWVGTSLSKSAKIDFCVTSMDIARIFFRHTDKIPEPVALHVPDDAKVRASALLEPYEDKLKVGVVWTGSTTYKGNGFRSFSHTDFLRLADIPGVQLFSLYKGPALAAFYADGSDAFILDAGARDRNFGDSAAMMQGLDLVISSDTATLHLAGSLGVPAWGVLHWDPFWVWGHKGDHTRWYPGMRLFRQKQALVWADVMADVETALRDYQKGFP